MKYNLIILFIIFSIFIIPQSKDSTEVKEIKTKIDSLKHQLKNLDDKLNELEKVKPDTTSKADEEIPGDQRSKRRQIDSLLSLLDQKVGGLNINGNATSIIQYNFQEEKNIGTATGSFDVYLYSNFGDIFLFFVDLEAIGGNGPNQFINTFSSLNADAGTLQSADGIDRLNVLEAWVEFAPFDNALVITTGKIDLTNYFDINNVANDETYQFISGAFVNSSAFAAPSNSPGIRFRTVIEDFLSVQLGCVKIDNTGFKIFSDLFKIGSLGFTILQDSDFESNVRLYGYTAGNIKNSNGFGLSIDQYFLRMFTIFGRFTKNNFDIAKFLGIKSSWSAGVQFLTNPFDYSIRLGFAAGKSLPLNSFLLNEINYELYGGYKINQWTNISLHFQYVKNAGGFNKDFFITGLRTQFNF